MKIKSMWNRPVQSIVEWFSGKGDTDERPWIDMDMHAKAIRHLARISDPAPTRKVPFKCPVCDGAGHLNRPPEVPGDQLTWVSAGANSHPCSACKGTGIVWSPS